MKVTIHAEGTPKQIAEELRTAANVYDYTPATTAAAEPAKKRGRPAKTEEPAADESEAEETETDAPEADAEDEENFSLDDDAPGPEKEEPKAKVTPAKEVTDTALVTAFRNYSTSKSREKALAVLKKYGVKAAKDIPQAKRAEVMKVLGA